MLTSPLSKASREELDAELSLYRRAGIEVVEPILFKTKGSCVEEITRLRALHGEPVLFDTAFIEANPTLARLLKDGGAQEGEIVFAAEATVSEAEALDNELAHRKDLLKSLSEHGVEVTADTQGLSTAELEAALANAEGKPQADEATVCDVKGKPARTYSRELHGKDFRALAEEFASKRDGWTVT